jgi:hypothetical protein
MENHIRKVKPGGRNLSELSADMFKETKIFLFIHVLNISYSCWRLQTASYIVLAYRYQELLLPTQNHYWIPMIKITKGEMKNHAV